MTEQHPAVRGHEVAAVVVAFGRSGSGRIEPEYAVGEELRVKAVGDDVGADGGGQQPRGVDRLTASECEHAERRGAEQRDERPEHDGHGPHGS